jgi:hypothetical protein
MNDITSTQDLSDRIERLVEDHIRAIHEAARAAVDRALGDIRPKAKPAPRHSAKSRKRRASSEVVASSERLYRAVCDNPGEAMTVLAAEVGASSRELHRPMMLLKQQGKVRSVGQRHATRYFPMAT